MLRINSIKSFDERMRGNTTIITDAYAESEQAKIAFDICDRVGKLDWKEESIKNLKSILKPKDCVYIILRKEPNVPVFAFFYVCVRDENRPWLMLVNSMFAEILSEPSDRSTGGFVVDSSGSIAVTIIHAIHDVTWRWDNDFIPVFLA